MATPLTNSINALTAYANEVTGASDTTLNDAVHTLASGYGGGTSVQITTGTVSGSGSIVLQIPCDFAPDLIYVHGDMTGDASLRGCVSLTIMKDTYLEATVDGSSNNTDEYIWWKEYGITGYSGDVSMPHGEYANGTVILDMVENSSSLRFNSAITYTYKFVKWT